MIAWIKHNFGRNWWSVRHINADDSQWESWKVQSLFGKPLTTFFFVACGPFDSKEESDNFIAKHFGES